MLIIVTRKKQSNLPKSKTGLTFRALNMLVGNRNSIQLAEIMCWQIFKV